jgi:hypothetical protein
MKTRGMCLAVAGLFLFAVAAQAGVTENGISENGISENGISENGVTENGVTENGISENGISENGFWLNGVAANECSRTTPTGMHIVGADAVDGRLMLAE